MTDHRINIEAKIQRMAAHPEFELKHSLSPKPYGVCVPVVPLLALPDYHQAPETQILFGAQVCVHAYCMVGGEIWALCQEIEPDKSDDQSDGYVGFVPRSTLMEMETPTHQVSVLKAPVLSSLRLKSPLRSVLPLNAQIHLVDRVGDYVQVAGLGYVHRDHVLPISPKNLTPVLPETDVQDFVDMAELHFGLPYIWGGNSSDGLDCSGLVQSALRAVGYWDAPRDADQQEKTLGRALDFDPYFSGLKRGDLIFWPGHVGIMGDETMLLHANAHHMGVAIEPLAEAAARIEAGSTGPVRSIRRLG